MGPGLAQHVPEQHRRQVLRRDGGGLDGGLQRHGRAVRRTVQSGLGGGDVEGGAHLLGQDGVRRRVVGGVFHLAVDGVIDLLGGDGPGGQVGKDHLHRVLVGPLLQGGRQVRPQLLRVRPPAGPGLGHGDGAAGDDVAPVLRGLGKVLRQVRRGLVQHGVVPPERDRIVVGAAGKGGEIPDAAAQKSRALHPLHGPLGDAGAPLPGVAQVPGGHGGEHGLAVLQCQHLGGQGRLQRRLGLGGRQPADGDAVHRIIGIERVQPGGKGAQSAVSRRQHARGDAQRRQHPLAAPARGTARRLLLEAAAPFFLCGGLVHCLFHSFLLCCGRRSSRPSVLLSRSASFGAAARRFCRPSGKWQAIPTHVLCIVSHFFKKSDYNIVTSGNFIQPGAAFAPRRPWRRPAWGCGWSGGWRPPYPPGGPRRPPPPPAPGRVPAPKS